MRRWTQGRNTYKQLDTAHLRRTSQTKYTVHGCRNRSGQSGLTRPSLGIMTFTIGWWRNSLCTPSLVMSKIVAQICLTHSGVQKVKQVQTLIDLSQTRKTPYYMDTDQTHKATHMHNTNVIICMHAQWVDHTHLHQKGRVNGNDTILIITAHTVTVSNLLLAINSSQFQGYQGIMQ